jgi:serine/threonine protein phosphatase PrpC
MEDYRGGTIVHLNHAFASADTLRVQAASGSDTGRVRARNEDALALCEPPDTARLAQLGRLYILADGAGGHAAGEVASRIAVDTIVEVYYQSSDTTVEAPEDLQAAGDITHLHGALPDLDLPCTRIMRAFHAAHTRIRQLATQHAEYTGMVTTCLAVVVKGTHLLIAHLGDSRAYLVHVSRPASFLSLFAGSHPTITCLTRDHSMATALAQVGTLSAEELHRSPSRHILIRALGENSHHPTGPDMTTRALQAGERLLQCCDGLWSLVPEEHMALVVMRYPPQKACAELIRLANEAGGTDNISVIVLSFV